MGLWQENHKTLWLNMKQKGKNTMKLMKYLVILCLVAQLSACAVQMGANNSGMYGQISTGITF